jgi:hypothetical protein
MFAKRSVVVDDEDDVTTMTIVFVLIKSCNGGYEMRFLWMSLECFRVFFAFICFCSMIESAANGIVVVVAMKLVCGG